MKRMVVPLTVSHGPFLEDPEEGEWIGPDYAITAMYAGLSTMILLSELFSSLSGLAICPENGKEELYHTAKDDHEWNNLALDPKFEKNYRISTKAHSSHTQSVPAKPKSDEFGRINILRKIHLPILIRTETFRGQNFIPIRKCLKIKRKFCK